MIHKILISAPFLAISGYSNYARTILKNILRLGDISDKNCLDPKVDVRIHVLSWGGNSAMLAREESILFDTLFQKPAFKDEEIKDVNYFHIALPTQYPLNDKNFLKFKRRINLTMFETDNVLYSWAELINKYCDTLIVPTEFNRETFSKKVNIPIEVITYIKDDFIVNMLSKLPTRHSASIYNKRDAKFYITNQKPIIFYHNCNFGARKGVKEILHAYLLAFKDNTLKAYEEVESFQDKESYIYKEEQKTRPTQLWLKWYRDIEHSIQDKFELLKFIEDARKETDNYESEVYLIHENLLASQLEAMYNEIDAYVMPSYGEGLNLPAAEAILHEKITILSNCSAHPSLLPKELNDEEFCKENNLLANFWIEGEHKIIEATPDPFYAFEANKEKHTYFYVDIESLKEQLHKAYNAICNEPEKISATTKYVKDKLYENYNPEKLSLQFMNILNKDYNNNAD